MLQRAPRIEVSLGKVIVQRNEARVLTAMVQGEPASRFSFSQLKDVSPTVVPALGFIPLGDGELWQSVLATPELFGADPAGSALAVANALVAGLATKAAAVHTHVAGDISGGTTGQFLRGDGTWSNALTGALSLGGDIIGTAAAATGSFFRTDSVSGSDNKIVGLHAANNFITSRTGYILVRGINAASNPGGVELRPCVAGGQLRLLFANANTALAIDTAMTLGAFTGSTATFSGAVATGALAVTGAMAATGAVSGTTGTFSGNINGAGALNTINGDISIVKTTGNAQIYFRPAVGFTSSFLDFYDSSGVREGFIRSNGANGLIYQSLTHTFRNVDASVSFATLNATALTLSGGNKIVYGSAGTTTAAQNETAGTSTGPRTNAASGSWVQNSVGNVTVATFGQGLGNATNLCFAVGQYGVSTANFAAPGIASSGSSIQYNSPSQHTWYLNSSANCTLRLGYALATANVLAWGIGGWACGAAGSATLTGWGSTGDGNMAGNVGTNGKIDLYVASTLRMSWAHIGGLLIGHLAAPIAIANSTTTTLMTVTNRWGRLQFFDNTGQWATVRTASTSVTIEAQSGNFEVAASASATNKIAFNVSAGSLQVITGSAAGTTIGATYHGL